MNKMSSNAGWQLRWSDQRAGVNADQSEFSAVVHGATNLESGIMDDRIADALDDYDVTDPAGVAAWAREDAKYDSATSDIGREIQRRIAVVGEYYPFKASGNRLEYIPSSTCVYEFCLAVSQSPSVKEGDFARLPPTFERLARDVLTCFLGSGAEGMRTGWPPDHFEKRPSRFKAVVEEIRARTKARRDWNWHPHPDLPNDPEPQDVKDEGIDFVVWKLMPDGRDGHLFLLGQCACGSTDWDEKFHDIDAEKLQRWIHPISTASFLRVFTTPHHIPNDAYFADVNLKAGLTLDRARIARLAESQMFRDRFAPELKDCLKELADLVIKSR
jgi:hypothetical protein